MNKKTILQLSTANLPYREFESLYMDKDKPFRHVDHKFGTILVLSDIEDGKEQYKKDTETNFPTLWGILEYVSKEGYNYIDFDQDADCLEGFKEFDW